jgi:hypothetical protein
MKKVFVFVFCMVSCLTISAQSYWALAWQGSDLYKKKEYAASVEAYKNAFKIRKDRSSDLYGAACSAALAGKKELALDFLKDAVKAGYTNAKHLQSDGDLASLHAEKEWATIVAQTEKNAVDIPKSYNMALRSALLEIDKDDQEIRRVAIDSTKKYGFTGRNRVMDSIFHVMGYNDSVNLIRITKILDSVGYPSVKSVGSDAARTVFLVIQHSDLKVQERYFNVLKKAVDDGNLHPANFALLEDRIALRQGKKQVYGSQVGADMKTGKYYVLPLEDPDKVDQRRMNIGLQPLSDYVKQWDIVWDVNDYKQKMAQGLIENTMIGDDH